MLTIQQVAKEFNVSPSLVYRLVADGEIPHTLIGSCKRVRREHVEEYIEQNTHLGKRLPKGTGRHF